jgi:hypothetical protein
MGIVTARWKDKQCRWENGLFLATDEFIPLVGTPETGYQAGAAEPFAEVLSRGAGDWAEVDVWCSCRDETRGLLVEAGGGPVEAEGFVALSDATTGELRWVLHLYDSEAFTAVSVNGEEIVAVAEEYPIRNEFRIPISEPQELRVRSATVT